MRCQHSQHEPSVEIQEAVRCQWSLQGSDTPEFQPDTKSESTRRRCVASTRESSPSVQIHETGGTWPVLARNGTYIQGINQGMFGPRGMRRARGSSLPRHLNREKIPFPTNSLNAQKGPSKWDCEVYIPPNLRDRPGHRLGNHTTP